MTLQQRIALAQSQNEPASDNSRQDGYTSGSPVFAFQHDVEVSPACNYDALRSTLRWAQNRAVSYNELMAHYNELVVYS
jgi:hypothetical protein